MRCLSAAAIVVVLYLSMCTALLPLSSYPTSVCLCICIFPSVRGKGCAFTNPSHSHNQSNHKIPKMRKCGRRFSRACTQHKKFTKKCTKDPQPSTQTFASSSPVFNNGECTGSSQLLSVLMCVCGVYQHTPL